MAEQLDMFAPKPQPVPARKKKGKDPVQECPRHNTGFVCALCPEQPETDGFGFPHLSTLKGREGVRLCRFCSFPVTREHWDADTAACTYGGCLEARSGPK
jgi:hypothetical protein